MFGARVAELRKKNRLKQSQFASELSSLMERETNISISTVSQWEIGSKMPNFDVLLAIADFFDVSTDFLLGKDAEKPVEKRPFYMDDYLTEISEEDLEEYNGKPVFLVFNNEETQNCWGIYDADTKQFSCNNKKMKLSSNQAKFFAVPPENLPYYRASEQRLSLSDFLKAKQFWVEYISPDENIRSAYSGWYKHDSFGNIIKDDGAILPHSGFDVYYYAYRNKV